jgi:hypothetical protein
MRPAVGAFKTKAATAQAGIDRVRSGWPRLRITTPRRGSVDARPRKNTRSPGSSTTYERSFALSPTARSTSTHPEPCGRSPTTTRCCVFPRRVTAARSRSTRAACTHRATRRSRSTTRRVASSVSSCRSPISRGSRSLTRATARASAPRTRTNHVTSRSAQRAGPNRESELAEHLFPPEEESRVFVASYQPGDDFAVARR